MTDESTNTMNLPRMMTAREIARTGVLAEHAVREMIKSGKAPHIMVGNKALVNFDRFLQILEEC